MFKKAVKEIRKDVDAAGKFMIAGSMAAGSFGTTPIAGNSLVALGFIGAGLWLVAKLMIVLEGDDPGG